MNIKSFLNSTLAKIISFINKILPSTKQVLDVALAVCNGIKAFTDSPVADVVVALIPGTTDDAVLAKVRTFLPLILVDLKLADAEAGKTADEIIKDGISTVQNMDAGTKAVTLQSIWKLLSLALTGNSVTLADLQKIAQSYYEEYGSTAQAV